jgi:hypothetical protein
LADHEKALGGWEVAEQQAEERKEKKRIRDATGVRGCTGSVARAHRYSAILHASADGQRMIPYWLPRDLVSVIDLSELASDTPRTRRELGVLEAETGHYIAAYRDGAEQRANAHCGFLEPADLKSADLDRIRDAERRAPGVVLVAYRRPVVWRRGGEE